MQSCAVDRRVNVCGGWRHSITVVAMAARIRQLIQDQLAAAPTAPAASAQLTDMFNRARTFFQDVRARL